MLNTLKRWLAPPVFAGDEEKTRQASLLNATILVVLFYNLAFLLSYFLGGRLPTGSIILAVALFLVGVVMRILLFRGWVRAVGWSFGILGIFAITLSVAGMGTIYAPATAMYLFPVVVSGLVFGVPGLLTATLLSSAAVAGVAVAEARGLLPEPVYTVTITQWITYTFIFGLTGTLTWFAYQNAVTALQRLRTGMQERRRVEEALQESEQRWQFALEGSGDGVWDWNAVTNEVYFSAQWKRMLGYEPEEIGSNLEEWDRRIHPDDREATYAELNRHMSGETESYTSEHRLQCKDGSYKWILDRGKVVSRTSEGKPLRVIGTHSDIDLRRNTEAALRENEARFMALFEQTHDAVFILDFEGNYLAVNRRAAEMLGYYVGELLSLSVRETSAQIDDSFNVIQRLLRGEQIPTYERLFRRKDGQVFPVEVSVELVRDDAGKPIHIQSVVRDISQRKADDAALKDANEKLSQHVKKVERLQEELREQALHDPLTGLYNRRHLSEMLGREIARARRENQPLSVVVSDIDHFKEINDTYGHQVGDTFLVEVSRIMTEGTRSSDFACRLGGEEFMMVLPGAGAEIAAKRAEEIRRKCADLAVQYQGKEIKVTISFGVATFPDHGQDAEEITIKADGALYKSKHSGRNRVTIWDKDVLNVPAI